MKATLSAVAAAAGGGSVVLVKPDLAGLIVYGYMALPFQWSSIKSFEPAKQPASQPERRET